MENDQRTLGTLIEQGKWFAAKLDTMEKKVDHLIEWKWRMWGVTAVIATLCTGAFEFLIAIIRHT